MSTSDNFSRPIIRTQDEQSRTDRRYYHVAPKKLTTSLQTLLTCGSKEAIQLANAVFSNGSNAAATITLYAVPPGVAAADAHIVLDQLSIPANSAYVVQWALGCPVGGSIQLLASVNNVIRASGWAIVYL